MANQSYYPVREGDQLTWLLNLSSKISSQFLPLDITPARQAKLQLTLAWLIWIWGTYLPSRRQEAPAATAWRNQIATGDSGGATSLTPPAPVTLTPPAGIPYSGMLSWLFEEIRRWKSAEGYQDTIGQTLGIIGSIQTAPDLTTLHPTLTATASGGSVKIGWGWSGYSTFLDLCEITVDRADAENFIPLAYDTTPGYEDTAPYPITPTKWTYKAIYRIADHQVGQWSPAVSVIVGG